MPAITHITNYYQVLTRSQPSSAQIANEAARVDKGDTTLTKVLLDIYNSPSRVTSHADELAGAFFVLTGRAPDYATYMQGMSILRAGTSFAALMDAVLAYPGYRLSTDAIPNNYDYIGKLYSELTGGGVLTIADQQAYTALINGGVFTRGGILAYALENASSLFNVERVNKIQKSLLSLAAASKEATVSDLILARGNVVEDIDQALTYVGLATPAGYAFFSRATATAPHMNLEGELTGDLVFNLQTDTFTLANKKSFKAYYSIDGGIDAGIVSFSALHAHDVLELDASGVAGKGKLLATGKTNAGDYRFFAPSAGSTLQGANGDDSLLGGVGVDKLIATEGTDTLTGGAGVDTFVFAQAAYYRTGSAHTTITDFGNGKDLLDFSLLLGSQAPKAASIAPILATSRPPVTLANGGVAVVENDGVWVNASDAVPATGADVAALFGAVFNNPTSTSRYVMITADIENERADVWLINNDTDVIAITSDEVYLVGQVNGDWNLMLNGLLPILR